MKRAVLFHNPKAGDSDHTPDDLLALVAQGGFSCEYISIKVARWKNFEETTDLLIAGGGDGCVRKVIEMLLKRSHMDPIFPLAIIPLGTANNLARGLGIPLDITEAVRSIAASTNRPLDIGFVKGMKRREFFVEGIGFGIFPALMRRMKGIRERSISAEERIPLALQVLHQVVQSFRPISMVFEADGVQHDGNYLLAEVLNTPSIGPNLHLAKNGNPGDGQLDLVLVSATEREHFLDYLSKKIRGENVVYSGTVISAKEVKIASPAVSIHVDDRLKRYAGGEITISLRGGLLQILAPCE